jgi:hypothetical protein
MAVSVAARAAAPDRTALSAQHDAPTNAAQGPVTGPPLSTAASHARPYVITGSPPIARGPMLWTAPLGVDLNPIDGISCPSSTLCVAVDRAGGVLWSTNPTAGARAWHLADVDSANELTGVSCPSTTLCVAVDAEGNVISSSDDPAGGAWSVAAVDGNAQEINTDTGGSVLMRGISCPSTSLCVAVDAVGDAFVSTDPTGGQTAWTPIHIDADRTQDCTGTGLACQPPLVGISCPSTALCAAVDFSGNVLFTGAPTAPAVWGSASATSGQLGSLWGISCPTASFCATVDGPGQKVMTFDPSVPGSIVTHALPEALDGIWCATSSLCLISAETGSGISGLLGSTDPAALHPTWSLGTLGGVNAISCLSTSVCIAADDEGDVAAGDAATAMGAALSDELLSSRHLPKRAALVRAGIVRLPFTSPIAGRVTLSWTQTTGSHTVTLAAATHTFITPGTTTLTLRLTGQGRQILSGPTRRVTLTATATFFASNGALSRSRKLTFVRPKPHKKRKKRRRR